MEGLSAGMLEVFVSSFAPIAQWHAGDIHPIIVNQRYTGRGNHHVAVLYISMRDSVLLKKARERGESCTSILNQFRVVDVFVQPNAQRITFNPCHFNDRIYALVDF